MIVILNGPLGVGKTETAWKLLECFDHAAILDADYVGGNVHPYDYHNPDAVRTATDSLVALAEHQHTRLGLANFVISGVFETVEQLHYLTSRLSNVDSTILPYLLMASESELENRVRNRANGDMNREVARAKELRQILLNPSLLKHLGKHVDTSGLSIEDVANYIWTDLHAPVL